MSEQGAARDRGAATDHDGGGSGYQTKRVTASRAGRSHGPVTDGGGRGGVACGHLGGQRGVEARDHLGWRLGGLAQVAAGQVTQHPGDGLLVLGELGLSGLGHGWSPPGCW